MMSRSSVLGSLGALTSALAAITLGAACAANSSSDAFSSGYTPVPTDASTSAPDIGLGSDAGSTSPSTNPVQGNPLCNASHYSGRCYPDDLTTAQACGIAPDGSANYDLDAGYGDAAVACHVIPLADAGVAPACTVAGTGTDGDTCRTSTDCAPSFECVGQGVCRQYCCYSTCDSTQFCDIQRETAAAGGLPVPVCMPIQPCTLLSKAAPAAVDGGHGATDADTGDADTADGNGGGPNAPDGNAADGNTAGANAPGTCAADQTCAVVALTSGVALTSCVQNGNAGVGASCESEHCAAGLMCIGTSGNRRCYQLCHTLDASTDCPSTQTCSGGLPLFTDPMAGVCRTTVSQDL
jgi:hypothetical protein